MDNICTLHNNRSHKSRHVHFSIADPDIIEVNQTQKYMGVIHISWLRERQVGIARQTGQIASLARPLRSYAKGAS